MALCEEWNNEDDPQEALLTAKATSATLAMTSSDETVADAIIQENISRSVITLLESEHPDLIHRSLIIIQSLVEAKGSVAANHLLEGGVVPAIGLVMKLGNEQLNALAREVAQLLSKAIKHSN